MNSIALRWKIVFSIFGILCALLALTFLSAPGEKPWSLIVPMGFFAFLLGIAPWLNLRRELISHLLGAILVLPLWGFAYLLIGGALNSPESGIVSQVVVLVLGAFCAFLGLLLLAQSLGFANAKVSKSSE
jgi:hypothetical protein